MFTRTTGKRRLKQPTRHTPGKADSTQIKSVPATTFQALRLNTLGTFLHTSLKTTSKHLLRQPPHLSILDT